MKIFAALLTNLEYWGFLLCRKTVMALPLHCAYAVSMFIFKIIFVIDIKHRNRVIRNMLHSGIVSDRKSAVALARKNFECYAKIFVEIFKRQQLINKDNFDHKVSISPESLNTINLLKKDGAQFILLTAHFGNWELLAPFHNFITGRNLFSIKRVLNNPKIGKIIFDERESMGHFSCERKGALKNMLKTLKDGGTIAMLVDQHASTSEGVETTFFGHPARTHSSPALLHLKTGIPIIVSVLKRNDNDFNFEFFVKDPIIYKPTDDRSGDIQKLTQLYTTQLEELIKICPEQWLWAHRRWLDIDRKRSK